MAVVGEPMEEYVLKQIEVRQNFAGKLNRDNNHHKFTTSRTSWIKLASGVELKKEVDDGKGGLMEGSKFGGGLDYPKKYVLFNGTSKVTDDGIKLRSGIGTEKSYDTSDKTYGIVPMPGILSAQIKSLNRGSIKRATIKIKANSRRQFEIIDELFLRIGYSMMLEWGWSHYLKNDTVDDYKLMGPTYIDEFWFLSPGGTDTTLRNIRAERYETNGNYDGMFGKVVNFTWNFNEDGTYDIELHLISHGDVIESLRILPSDLGESQIAGSATISCFKQYFNSRGWKSLKFSKTDPILEICKHKDDMNIIGAESWLLDTSSVKDKLGEYLFALSMFGYGVFSNVNQVAVESVGDPDEQTVTRMAPWHIYEYKPYGGKTQKYEGNDWDPTGSVYLNNLSVPSLISGYRYNHGTNLSNTTTGISGFYSWSEEVSHPDKKKKNIYETIIAYDGGFQDPRRFVDAAVGEDQYFTAAGFTEMNRVYNPMKDPHHRSYVRLGHLLKAIEKWAIPVNEEGDPQFYMETDKTIPIYVPPTKIGYKQATEMSIQSYKPKTIILSNEHLTVMDTNATDNYLTGTNKEYGFLQTFYNFAEKCWDNYPTPSGAQLPYILGENIYISIPYLMTFQSISKNDNNETVQSIYTFLKDVCQEINVALGAVNNIEPVLDSNTNTLRIQDSTNFPAREELYKSLKLSRWGDEDIHLGKLPNEKDYQPIQVYGYRQIDNHPVASFVRKISLQTKISKDFATIASIGATAGGGSPGIDSTALSRFNVGKINRFAENWGFNVDQDVVTPKTISEQRISLLFKDQIIDVGNNDCSNFLGYQVGSMNTHMAGFNGGNPTSTGIMMDDGTQTKNQNFFRNYFLFSSHENYKNGNAGSPQIGFLPFEFSLDMDGLSGVKIYNKINVDTSFLPSNYGKSLEFVIKGIEHSLTDNDWVTKLITIAVPRTSGEDIKISTGINLAPGGATPPSPSPSPSPTGFNSIPGSATGVYLPPQKALIDDGTNYVDMFKSINSARLKKLVNLNGGEFPISLYTKPGDVSGKLYGKVINFIGNRNQYEVNPTFKTNNLTTWSYTSPTTGWKKTSSKVNKLWAPTLTQIARHLDSKGMWNSDHIKTWSPGFLTRDVTPSSGIKYGLLSGHAFGMAIDINSSLYPLGSNGLAKWETDYHNGVKTALVHQEIYENFVNVQGGAQKVFWAKSSRDVHHFAVILLV